MINIIEKKIARQLQLINLLIEHENGLAIEEIANQLIYSESTITKDLDYLNNTYTDYLSIQIINKRLYFKSPQSSKLNDVQYLIINQSKNIQLLTELLINPFGDIAYYSNAIGISHLQTSKIIKDINNFLTPYNISVLRVNKKFFLEALSELHFRKIFSLFLSETKSYTLKDLVNESKQYDSVQTMIQATPFKNSILIQEYFHFFVYLSNRRSKQGFHLESTEEMNQEQLIKGLLYSPYKNNLFFYNPNFKCLETYLDSLFKQNKEKSKSLLSLIIFIYENEISFQIPPSLLLNRLNYSYFKFKEKKHLYQSFKNIMEKISSIIKLNLEDYEVFLNYMILIYFPEILNRNSGKVILIESSLSKQHAFFLKYYLSNKFNNLYNFTVASDTELNHETYEDTIFITNNPYLNKENKIIINDFPTLKDLQSIEMQLHYF